MLTRSILTIVGDPMLAGGVGLIPVNPLDAYQRFGHFPDTIDELTNWRIG